MTHKYEQNIDVRDPSGFYVGALTYALPRYSSELHIRSCDLTSMRHDGPPTDPLPPTVIRSLRIPLTLYTICKRAPGSILWSERTCIMVGGMVDLHILLDGGYMVIYGQDPFGDDERDWISAFTAQLRRLTQCPHPNA